MGIGLHVREGHREEQVEVWGERTTPEHRVDQPKWQVYSRMNRGALVKREVEIVGEGSYNWRKNKKEREGTVRQARNQGDSLGCAESH